MVSFILDPKNPKDREELKSLFGEIFTEELKSFKSPRPEPDSIVTAREAARKFKVSPETISDWFKSGKLPGGFRLAGRLYFFESALIEGLKSITVKRKK